MEAAWKLPGRNNTNVSTHLVRLCKHTDASAAAARRVHISSCVYEPYQALDRGINTAFARFVA